MKRARSYDLLGEFEKIRDAEDIEERERDAHEYRCLNPACSATFHFRRAANPLENTSGRAASFVHNSNSPHVTECDYDYENKVARRRDVSFFKDGLYHLRINFPLGSDPRKDVYPNRARLSAAQRRRAAANVGKKCIGTLAGVVKLIESEFESLENGALENLVLYYQGNAYEWPEIFVPADGYEKIFEAATRSRTDETRPLLTVVMPEREIDRSPSGKKKISCRAQQIIVDGRAMKIRPVISFETDALAEKFRVGETFLITGRPMITAKMRDQSELSYANGKPAYFHIHDERQITRISDNYWRNRPVVQMKLFDKEPK